MLQLRDERGKARVLRVAKRLRLVAFELDTNRKVIAGLTPAPARGPRMPGALVESDELHQFPVSP